VTALLPLLSRMGQFTSDRPVPQPSSGSKAGPKSSDDRPCKYSSGSTSATFGDLSAHAGRLAEANRAAHRSTHRRVCRSPAPRAPAHRRRPRPRPLPLARRDTRCAPPAASRPRRAGRHAVRKPELGLSSLRALLASTRHPRPCLKIALTGLVPHARDDVDVERLCTQYLSPSPISRDVSERVE
jgi:hypothetical protein